MVMSRATVRLNFFPSWSSQILRLAGTRSERKLRSLQCLLRPFAHFLMPITARRTLWWVSLVAKIQRRCSVAWHNCRLDQMRWRHNGSRLLYQVSGSRHIEPRPSRSTSPLGGGCLAETIQCGRPLPCAITSSAVDSVRGCSNESVNVKRLPIRSGASVRSTKTLVRSPSWPEHHLNMHETWWQFAWKK